MFKFVLHVADHKLNVPIDADMGLHTFLDTFHTILHKKVKRHLHTVARFDQYEFISLRQADRWTVEETYYFLDSFMRALSVNMGSRAYEYAIKELEDIYEHIKQAYELNINDVWICPTKYSLPERTFIQSSDGKLLFTHEVVDTNYRYMDFVQCLDGFTSVRYIEAPNFVGTIYILENDDVSLLKEFILVATNEKEMGLQLYSHPDSYYSNVFEI